MNEHKKKLRLIESNSMSEATQRIFAITRETCENFNNYYLDFFESIAILSEKKEEKKTPEKIKEIEEQIAYMHNKIDELSGFMHELTEKMPGMVELIDVE